MRLRAATESPARHRSRGPYTRRRRGRLPRGVRRISRTRQLTAVYSGAAARTRVRRVDLLCQPSYAAARHQLHCRRATSTAPVALRLAVACSCNIVARHATTIATSCAPVPAPHRARLRQGCRRALHTALRVPSRCCAAPTASACSVDCYVERLYKQDCVPRSERRKASAAAAPGRGRAPRASRHHSNEQQQSAQPLPLRARHARCGPLCRARRLFSSFTCV